MSLPQATYFLTTCSLGETVSPRVLLFFFLEIVNPVYNHVHLCDVISAPLCMWILDTKVTDTQGDIIGAICYKPLQDKCADGYHTLNTLYPPF